VKPKRVTPKPKKKQKTLSVPAKPPRIPPASHPKQLAATPVATPTGTSSDGPVSMAVLALGGLLLGLVAIGISVIPAWSLPIAVGLRLERNRQSIALTGIAIGVACAFVGLLDVVSGQ
jgi:hypothetical protein